MPMLKSEYETGAYEWINSVNGKRYVGGAYKSFDDRRETHLYALRSGKARNLHFQAAWNKYGEAAFEFVILERCQSDKETVKACEQRWLDDRFQVPEMVYNICRYAESSIGVKRRPETLEKMRVAVTGTKQTEETIAKRVAKLRGQKREGEALENLRRGAYKRPPVSDTERIKRAIRAQSQFVRAGTSRITALRLQPSQSAVEVVRGFTDEYVE